ncbi:MAG TPA: glycogen debranching protein GlgX [Polyangiaceae bacterium]|jgi:glycogen operon protein|nr:glycogen debranching protein GlgX [Polyangiaceae bacterium]
MRTLPGNPQPLGATWDGQGVNFALFSDHATSVELCLFDAVDHTQETFRVSITEATNRVWHVYLPDARPGQLYGYRVHGPFAPERGHRFNPHKLLLDPYAKAIAGNVVCPNEVFGYPLGGGDDAVRGVSDSARVVPKSMVIESAFTWGDDRPPRVPWDRTLIYECSVRGMTKLHPKVPPELRGTYLGLASEPILDHLTSLKVTAVELLPVQQRVSERHLSDRGLSNYWGYNTIGFFAPDPRFATGHLGQQVSEFKTMVKTLHQAGIEIILDVVYNHTGEGNHHGPTLCFRGIDNQAYYRLDSHNARYYFDYTGCGNSINMLHPRTLQLVLDSLRYWVQEMHVDGFRFDLATTLARDPHDFDAFSRFFAVIQQDPVLSRVKLIAEPWDLGAGGYRLGGFPSGWAEWNARYRDCVRRFWRADDGQVPELASRLSGSSDIFEGPRGPFASINFVTCHDGFTLRDLVSFNHKHNVANGEENRDGTDENFSRNWGAEGETSSPQILRMRQRMTKNLLATLAFSQGVPMLSQGDEIGRTQRGNNNAYCQDGPISYLDWNLGPVEQDLLAFTRDLFAIAESNPALRRSRFFQGGATRAGRDKDCVWLRPDGKEFHERDWSDSKAHYLGMLIRGDAADKIDARGRHAHGQTLLLLLNAGSRAQRFVLPRQREAGRWREAINTSKASRALRKVVRASLDVAPHSVVLLCYELGDTKPPEA